MGISLGGCYGAATFSRPPFSLILSGVLQKLDAWLSVSVEIEFCPLLVVDRSSVDVVLAPYGGGRFSVFFVFFGGAGLHFDVNSYQNGRGKQ